jgi:hypothetical protein
VKPASILAVIGEQIAQMMESGVGKMVPYPVFALKLSNFVLRNNRTAAGLAFFCPF